MRRPVVLVLHAVAIVAIAIEVDVKFFQGDIWARLAANAALFWRSAPWRAEFRGAK